MKELEFHELEFWHEGHLVLTKQEEKNADETAAAIKAATRT